MVGQCLTAAQKKGRRMRDRGISYRGGYTRQELKEMREAEKLEEKSEEKGE